MHFRCLYGQFFERCNFFYFFSLFLFILVAFQLASYSFEDISMVFAVFYLDDYIFVAPFSVLIVLGI